MLCWLKCFALHAYPATLMPRMEQKEATRVSHAQVTPFMGNMFMSTRAKGNDYNLMKTSAADQ